jgi:hypothetical protein
MNTALAPRLGSIAAVLCVGLFALAPTASAYSCQQWSRLSPAGKSAEVEAMIEDALNSQRGRSYQVNRNAIGRCLYARARDIQYAFDDVCYDERTAGMQAISNTFKNYVWSCVK